MDYDLIVIGSGPAGYHAAIHAASFYKKHVMLVEKHLLGGVCLNAGCIPAKTWLNTAHLYEKQKTTDLEFLRINHSAFNFSALQSHKDKIINTLRQSMLLQLKNLNVEYKEGNAQLIDDHTVKIENNEFSSNFILIATGSHPKESFPFLNKENTSSIICTPEQVFNSSSLPDSISIVGGGINGVEFADFYASVGCKVNLIEINPTLLNGLDTDIVKRLTSHLKRKGISLFLSAKIQEITENIIQLTAETTNGSQFHRLSSDRILLAAGRLPNVNHMSLPNCHTEKLTYGKQHFSQSIYAAGDVTGENMFAHVAEYQGIKCVDSMFGDKSNSDNISVFPIVVYTNPEIAAVGLTEEMAKQQGISYKTVLQPMGISGRFLIEHPNETGLVKILFSHDGYILGIHMIGGQCSELISFATMLIAEKKHVREIEDIIFPHPVISEVLKYAFRKFYS